MPVTEFIRWAEYFRRKDARHDETELLLAQLTYYVYRIPFMLGGEPDKKPTDFLLKRVRENPDPLPRPRVLPASKAARRRQDRRLPRPRLVRPRTDRELQAIKSPWLAWAGITDKDVKAAETKGRRR